jgi:multidrug efflux pump subunit AcrB
MIHDVIRWFAKNSVAANLLMLVIIFAGSVAISGSLVYEVFPSTPTNVVVINVSYRGATPYEVEKGVIIRIEESIQDIPGIEEMRSIASEGRAMVQVEIEKGYNVKTVLDDIKNNVDAINTFPDVIERPIYKIEERKREVISVIVSADLPEADLRKEAETIRDDLLAIPGVTQIDLEGIRRYEISIEVPEHLLQKYKLSFDQISRAIRNSSLDIPAGNIKTKGGEVQLRTVNQAYTKEDFAAIPIINNPNGVDLRLGDIADIKDGFEENPIITRFNGKQAVLLDLYRVGDQNAIQIADDVKNYIDSYQKDNVKLSFWRDRSALIKGRLNTLLTSALQGGILVFILLAMFLRFSIAIWVCIGIPISFLGTLACLPFLGVTINILSLFAFILVLGIVVDDAIVTGENIFTHYKTAKNGEEAAIEGTVEVSMPVIFGVLTTIAAFMPLIVLEGRMADIFNQIPLVVIPVLLFSLIESKLILPSHLKHMKLPKERSTNILLRCQEKIASGLEVFVAKIYQPILKSALRWRYLTVAVFVSVTAILITMATSGRIPWTPFPRVDHEVITVTLEMPLGTNFTLTQKYMKKIIDSAEKIRDEYIDENGLSMISGLLSYEGSRGDSSSGQSHIGQVMLELSPPESRTKTISANDLSTEWRKLIGPLPGEAKLSIKAELGHGSNPVDIRLSGADFQHLETAGERIKEFLRTYDGVFDIADSFEGGKEEIRFNVKPEAEILGVTSGDLGKQIRQSFFGEEAQRIQRGRDDIRVMLRYPEEDRKTVSSIESMKIRRSDGTEIPFSEVADLETGRGFAKIFRIDRQRTINITADINKDKVNTTELNREIEEKVKKILNRFPDIRYSLEGESRDAKETSGSLISGLIFALFTIYALLAIPFKSYTQPFIVMSVIPFGLGGAILGHIILGMSLSMMSLFGMLALAGVVVNDSLVLVDYVNKNRTKGMRLLDAAHSAGGARFRPIILTSLTTFAGLTPLLLEKSTQAQFLIPMAVSLGFGVLYATAITLFLIPANYLILEDIANIYRKKPSNI